MKRAGALSKSLIQIKSDTVDGGPNRKSDSPTKLGAGLSQLSKQYVCAVLGGEWAATL